MGSTNSELNVVWNVPLVIIIIVIMMVRHAAFLVLGELCKQVMKIKKFFCHHLRYMISFSSQNGSLRDNDI